MLKFGFWGSLGSNSLPELIRVHGSFRYRSIFIPDRCVTAYHYISLFGTPHAEGRKKPSKCPPLYTVQILGKLEIWYLFHSNICQISASCFSLPLTIVYRAARVVWLSDIFSTSWQTHKLDRTRALTLHSVALYIKQWAQTQGPFASTFIKGNVHIYLLLEIEAKTAVTW